MADKNRNLRMLLQYVSILALVCTASGTVAYGQTFSCPQVVLSESHTCSVGNCKGQYSVNVCNTDELTSSYQCVYQTPTCCGQPQVAFSSAAEGSDCTNGCSSVTHQSASPVASARDKIKGKSAEAGAKQVPQPAKVVAKESKS